MSTCRRRTIQFSKIVKRKTRNRFLSGLSSPFASPFGYAFGTLGKGLDPFTEPPTQHPNQANQVKHIIFRQESTILSRRSP